MAESSNHSSSNHSSPSRLPPEAAEAACARRIGGSADRIRFPSNASDAWLAVILLLTSEDQLTSRLARSWQSWTRHLLSAKVVPILFTPREERWFALHPHWPSTHLNARRCDSPRIHRRIACERWATRDDPPRTLLTCATRLRVPDGIYGPIDSANISSLRGLRLPSFCGTAGTKLP